ncbi:MAG: hypothetical protein ABWY19_01435 [Marmoricola sp.]
MPLAVSIDSSTWAALALVLTVIGAALSWVAWRRRGIAAGMRGLAWTLVPVAAWLTGTQKLAVEIIDDVSSWAARLVFSPAVWAGIIVAAGSVGLFVLSGMLRSRGIGVRGKAAERATRKAERVQAKGAVPVAPAQRKQHSDDLDDMDDIEAILKKHGI